jgi:hypothetical protein
VTTSGAPDEILSADKPFAGAAAAAAAAAAVVIPQVSLSPFL